jgi:hypothetical protein
MTTWRMSFRVGNQGHEMWPECFRRGVAAMTYDPLRKTDLSKYSKGEPKELWAQLQPAQKASLRRIAYEIKADDVIYLKQGPKIVSKGIVKGSYYFDSKFSLITPDGGAWAHQVPVEWASDFPEIKIFLGSEPLTVKKLSSDSVRKLEAAVGKTIEFNQQKEAIEGEISKREAMFRSRNQALIRAKKANSDCRCDVCGFSFEETYGEIGKKYIIAHHLKPISSGVKKTTLDDIALVCANCHAMIHVRNPIFSIEGLKAICARA